MSNKEIKVSTWLGDANVAVAHNVRIVEVRGSNPLCSTTQALQAKMLAERFFIATGGKKMKSNGKHPLVKQLSICGQVAEHKSEKIQASGGDEEVILKALNDEQRAQLAELPGILQKDWRQDHAAHHRKG